MKHSLITTVFSCTILLALTVGPACNKNKRTMVPNAYTVDNNNRLVRFDLNDPGFTAGIKITNLQPGESIVGLDVRPVNGVLYGLGSSNHLYIIDSETGVATRIQPAFTPALSGTAFGFDFNPSADRIRVISNTGQNLRLHPVTGEVVATDGAITPAGVVLSACAYSNNAAGATSTELYAIDVTSDKLYKLATPNTGIATAVGSLGVDVDVINGFDIAGADKGYALLTIGGVTKLYSVNLSTGELTDKGVVPITLTGQPPVPVTSFAVIP
jgi:hypothetical protein